MFLAIINVCSDRTVRVQRKDKRGKFGTKLELEDVPPRKNIKIKAEAGNRFRVWFIDGNQSLYPGTRHIKMNIGSRVPARDIELIVSKSEWDRWPELALRGSSGSYAVENNFTLERPRNT